MDMYLNNYMNNKFPNIGLRPPLLHNWHTGIRFELGSPNENNMKHYMERVYFRTLSLFKSLHSLQDEIIIVANVHQDEKSRLRKKLKIFQHYIKSKDVLIKLQHNTIPFVFEEVDASFNLKTDRYNLRCNVSDVKYIKLIKAICNRDMDILPKILHDIFFINMTNDTIFHVYDDRGCDVIALNKESISPLYKNYNDWILDYERDKIDKIFR